MNTFAVCPCCSNTMVRQVSHYKTYWFCRSCWQEMPDLPIIREENYHRQNRLVNLSINSVKRNQAFTV